MKPTLREHVILIHGLAASRRVMRSLQGDLSDHGFAVTNWGYQSIPHSIQRHADAFSRALREMNDLPGCTRLHIVGHSMGCIVTRMALHATQVTKLRHLVMLAPPNSGSPVAHQLSRWFGWISPPLRELSDRPGSLVRRLPPPADIAVGIIAASRDRVVPLENTRLPNQRDHITLPGRHKLLPLRADTAAQVRYFLRHGVFAPDAVRELGSQPR
ncbi:MAG TPA: alpha/beta fold hydrolase [Pirellulaceae bacterium]